MTRPRRRWLFAALGAAIVVTALVLFPGQRLRMAFTLGTGVGREDLQGRIDALEAQAINGAAFSEDDREFLSDFYRTLATGAKLTVVVRQTGRLMDHYLDSSGTDYRLAPEIFRQNAKVQAQLLPLRKRAAHMPCSGVHFTSPTFYMPDASKIDSVFGLYHGQVRLTRTLDEDGRCISHVRAEVPWFWPSYTSLKQQHGDYHAESFPLPNLKCLLFGPKQALFVDNGLGQYLVELRLARPFLAFAEWDE